MKTISIFAIICFVGAGVSYKYPEAGTIWLLTLGTFFTLGTLSIVVGPAINNDSSKGDESE